MTAKYEFRLVKAASAALLVLGSGGLAASVLYGSSVLAFIGLGLVFWGALLLYVQPEEYTQKALLDAGLKGVLLSLGQMMRELGYEGTAVYLPPRYFQDPEQSKVYISKVKTTSVPEASSFIKLLDNVVFLRGESARGMLLTPPGADLSKLLEEKLKVSFTRVDMDFLFQNLPRLFIEDLEIAENFEIEVHKNENPNENDDSVHLKVLNSVFEDSSNNNGELSYVFSKVGSPVCSAVACALAKATGKIVSLENTVLSEDGTILEADYKLLGMVEQEKTVEPVTEETPNIAAPIRRTFRARIASTALAITGIAFLLVVAYLVVVAVVLNGNNIVDAFFRTDGLGGLGIGMRVIYYFIIGLVLLLFSLVFWTDRKFHNGSESELASVKESQASPSETLETKNL